MFDRLRYENRTAMVKIAEMSAQAGAKASIILLPELMKLNPYPRQAEYGDLKHFLEMSNIGVMDLLPGLSSALSGDASKIRIDPNDKLHPNLEGNRLIACLLLKPVSLMLGMASVPVPDGCKDILKGGNSERPRCESNK